MTGVEDRPLYGYDEYVAKVMADIEEAEELLAEDPCRTYNLNTHVHAEVDDNFYHYRKFRFNYFALKALKARVYLYVGDKPDAYKEAMEIIQTKNPDGTAYFKLAGDNDFNRSYFALPSETIMGLSNSALENNENERLFKNDQSVFPMLFTCCTSVNVILCCSWNLSPGDFHTVGGCGKALERNLSFGNTVNINCKGFE